MRVWTLLVLVTARASSVWTGSSGLRESRCFNRACNPRIGNLSKGRVWTTGSVCGSNSTESFCVSTCSAVKCGKCRADTPGLAHPPSAMSDSSFRSPDTWWQSAGGLEEETLQLDLETEFLFTHIILVFRSPRPAAMILERSQDRGRTWKTLRVFARDCRETFGLREGVPGGGAAACSSKYSGASPCTRGEVIYRALPPWLSVDPYGAAARDQLTITNLRVRLMQHQKCPCRAKRPGPEPRPDDHFAIYDFMVKGSCLCNGHADQCVPARGYRHLQHRPGNMVHGRCVCRHNTAGDHCERCSSLYNDRPWRAANGITGSPQQCQKCKCNGHAKSCRLSRTLWLASRRRSGGVCDDCRHNTEGRHCQDCKGGFFRDPALPRTSPDSCRPCSCHPAGSVLSGGVARCDPSSGRCTCKPGVRGPHCEGCSVGYWGLHEYGCRPCDCTGDCDPYTGDCISGSGHMTRRSNGSRTTVFRAEELFSALHHSEKCECVEVSLSSSKLFCAAEFDFVLVVLIQSAHDKGSHAEVEVKVRKVLFQTPQVKILKGSVVLYPESWTTRGCTCPVLNPGSEYVVAGHQDRRTGRMMVNTKSLVVSWKSTLNRKLMHILTKDCGR